MFTLAQEESELLKGRVLLICTPVRGPKQLSAVRWGGTEHVRVNAARTKLLLRWTTAGYAGLGTGHVPVQVLSASPRDKRGCLGDTNNKLNQAKSPTPKLIRPERNKNVEKA